jgi:hypothetical protein
MKCLQGERGKGSQTSANANHNEKRGLFERTHDARRFWYWQGESLIPAKPNRIEPSMIYQGLISEILQRAFD